MCFVYKIENDINDKLYIGLTTKSLNKRWKLHVAFAKRNKDTPLYIDIRKYGVDNFRIVALFECDNVQETGKMERFYIRKFNTIYPNGYNITAGGERNQFDGNPRSKLNIDDVKKIRDIYSKKTMSCRQCYENYQDKISFSAFQKIWEGTTWKDISFEVYTEENRKFHNDNWHSLLGERNGNGNSDGQILSARLFYVQNTLKATYIKYGDKYSSIDSFRSALIYGYKHIPIYRKTSKQWDLNNEIIDINTYLNSNPVSTIFESEE
jgi:group I intron endonuclease